MFLDALKKMRKSVNTQLTIHPEDYELVLRMTAPFRQDTSVCPPVPTTPSCVTLGPLCSSNFPALTL